MKKKNKGKKILLTVLIGVRAHQSAKNADHAFTVSQARNIKAHLRLCVQPNSRLSSHSDLLY